MRRALLSLLCTCAAFSATTAWAQATPPATTAPTTQDVAEPLAPMPEMEVAWPDLNAPIAQPPSLTVIEQPQPGVTRATTTSDARTAGADTGVSTASTNVPAINAPTAPVAVSTAPPNAADAIPAHDGKAVRYDVAVNGVDGVADELFRLRFDELSALERGAGDAANRAQIERRAAEDRQLLTRLLKNKGYYDGQVQVAMVRRVDDRVEVQLNAEPGIVYIYTDVQLRGLDPSPPMIREQTPQEVFGIQPGDDIDADEIVLGTARLRAGLVENGYAFARLGEPDLLIDRSLRSGALTLDVNAGDQYRHGAIRLTGNTSLLPEWHLQRIARFEPGDIYRESMLDDLRRAVIATGLVSSVDVQPIPAAAAGTVDVAVNLTPAPLRTISAQLGYSTGEGIRAEAAWEHRNLFPPEGALMVRGVAGTREQLFGVQFRRNNYKMRDRVLRLEALANHVARDAYDARTFRLSGSLERQSNLIFQKPFGWSIGAELIATDERAFIPALGVERRRTYLIGALPMGAYFDQTNSLLDPTSGYRVALRLSPEASLRGGLTPYVKGQIDGSYYQPMGDNLTLAGRVRVGTLVGSGAQEIAPSRRYYAGGGGSVRGYGYQQIGAFDISNAPIGGKSLFEVSAEARYRLGLFGGNFGVVPFVDAGNVYDTALPGLTDLQFGAGLGLRYYSPFGPIRIDLATPLNPRPGDGWIAVYVSLGQSF